MEASVWTFSNLLSLARLLLTVPIAVLLAAGDHSSRTLAAVLIVVAILTDFFDGLVARKLGQVTEFGKIVDPLADKIAVGVVAWILAAKGSLPVWFLITILARDGLILLGGTYLKRTRGIVLQSNDAGKWAVTCLAVLLLFTILDIPGALWINQSLLAASTAMLVVSFGMYLRRFLDVSGKEGAVGGIS